MRMSMRVGSTTGSGIEDIVVLLRCGFLSIGGAFGVACLRVSESLEESIAAVE